MILLLILSILICMATFIWFIYTVLDACGLTSNNKYYTGGHAAGRVHHRRSWEEYPEDKYYRR